jgi:hypothetical protein
MTPGVSMLFGRGPSGSAEDHNLIGPSGDEDVHLALELLHNVQEAVVDIGLIVKLDLQQAKGRARCRARSALRVANRRSKDRRPPSSLLQTTSSLVLARHV